MPIDSAAGTAATPSPASSAAGMFGGAKADFDMFLKLLTTQMQNQDPLDPMDTSEYTQQLVQYSQVEQSIQQTGVLRDILSRLSSQDMASATGFIGHEAEFDTDVSGLGQAAAQWSWSMPRNAASLTATIVDGSGKAVATRQLDPGETSGRFSWDGMLASGGRAPEGAYRLQLEAADAAGATLPVTIRSVGRVDSVMSDAGNLMLGVNGTETPAASLVRVTAGA